MLGPFGANKQERARSSHWCVGHFSRQDSFAMWNHPVAICVWCRGLLLDAVILRQHRQRLPRILYTDVAWEQRVSSTWNKPDLVPGAGDAVLGLKIF